MAGGFTKDEWGNTYDASGVKVQDAKVYDEEAPVGFFSKLLLQKNFDTPNKRRANTPWTHAWANTVRAFLPYTNTRESAIPDAIYGLRAPLDVTGKAVRGEPVTDREQAEAMMGVVGFGGIGKALAASGRTPSGHMTPLGYTGKKLGLADPYLQPEGAFAAQTPEQKPAPQAAPAMPPDMDGSNYYAFQRTARDAYGRDYEALSPEESRAVRMVVEQNNALDKPAIAQGAFHPSFDEFQPNEWINTQKADEIAARSPEAEGDYWQAWNEAGGSGRPRAPNVSDDINPISQASESTGIAALPGAEKLAGPNGISLDYANALRALDKPGTTLHANGDEKGAFLLGNNQTPFYGENVGPKGRIANPAAEAQRLKLTSGLADAPTQGFFNPATSALLQGGVAPKQTLTYYQKQLGARGGKLPPGAWEKATDGIAPDQTITRDELVQRLDAVAPQMKNTAFLDEDAANEYGGPSAQFKDFATRGPFDNYRETVVGYPSASKTSIHPTIADKYAAERAAQMGAFDEALARTQEARRNMSTDFAAAMDKQLEAQKNIGDLSNRMREESNALSQPGAFTDSHFDHPNMEGWYRTQDITEKLGGFEKQEAALRERFMAGEYNDPAKAQAYDRDLDALQQSRDQLTRILEEVQPQRYQKMRDAGEGASPEQMAEWSRQRDMAKANTHYIRNDLSQIWGKYQDSLNDYQRRFVAAEDQVTELRKVASPEDIEKVNGLIREYRDAYDTIHHLDGKIIAGKSGVAKSPYTHDVNAATDILLKNALRDATKDDVGKIAWTPGETQAERYNQALRDVKGLRYDPESRHLYMRKASDSSKDGWYSVASGVDQQKLVEYVGKDAADRLLSQPRKYEGAMHSVAGPHTIEFPEGMTLGGDGMKAYYGSGAHGDGGILTSRIKSILRKITGREPEVRPQAFETRSRNNVKGQEQFPAVDLTPEARAKIKKTGLSLFSNGDEKAALAGMSTADRRKAFGAFDTPFYHSTTRHIPPTKGFADPTGDGTPYEPESYHGKAIYHSSSLSDSADNYGGMGPDLTNRVTRDAERAAWEIEQLPDSEKAKLKRVASRLERAGVEFPSYFEHGVNRLAFAKAYRDLVGKKNDVHKQALAPQNPVRLGAFEGKPETYFDMERAWVDEDPETGAFVVKDSDGKEISRHDNEGDAYDEADSIEPSGAGARIAGYLTELGRRYRLGDRGTSALNDIISQLYDGISAQKFEQLVRESDLSSYLIDEGISPGQMIQDAYSAAGYDAVIMPNAEKVFPGMNIPPNTTHTATFDARRVRDYDKAKFDPKRRDSKNWLAASGPASAAFATDEEER